MFNYLFLVGSSYGEIIKFFFISIGAFIVVFYSNSARRGRLALYSGVILGGIITLVDVIYSNAVIQSLPTTNYISSFITGSETVESIHPNYFGLVLLYCFICSYTYIYVVKSKLKKLSLIIITIAYCIGIILTGARAAVLCAVILALYIFNHYYRGPQIAKWLRIIFFGVLLIFTINILFSRVTQIFKYEKLYYRLISEPREFYRKPTELGSGTLSWRVYHNWPMALRLIKDNPILGVGFGNVLSPHLQSKYYFQWKTVHNSVLEILSELGVIGLLFFVFFYYNLFKHAYKYCKESHAIFLYFSIIIGTLIFSLLHHYHDLIQSVNCGCLGGIASEYYFFSRTKSQQFD